MTVIGALTSASYRLRSNQENANATEKAPYGAGASQRASRTLTAKFVPANAAWSATARPPRAAHRSGAGASSPTALPEFDGKARRFRRDTYTLPLTAQISRSAQPCALATPWFQANVVVLVPSRESQACSTHEGLDGLLSCRPPQRPASTPSRTGRAGRSRRASK